MLIHLRHLLPVLLAAMLVAGCGALPSVPAYPYYSKTNQGVTADVSLVNAQAQQKSDALYQYIDGWFKGVNPATLPAHLIPNGTEPGVQSFTLIPESAIDPATQWGERLAQTSIDFQDSVGEFPDPHCTYKLLPAMLAPFGTKVIIEGEFPHCRYFSIQPSPAFFPQVYRYNGFGSGEVALVDADIDPLPGQVNPFRVGADRNATNRSFKITLTMARGDPTAMDPAAWTMPAFRQAGNTRFCSGLQFRGPWGDADWKLKDAAHSGDGRGVWDVGTIWMRYYAPDNSKFPNAGVTNPKVTYELPDGRRFYIQTDYSAFAAMVNLTGPVAPAKPQEPDNPGVGWLKQWGIFRVIAEGLAHSFGWYLPLGGITNMTPQQYVHALDRNAMGRGPDMPAHGKLEPHATAGVHINYLVRGMACNQGKVVVISGAMPSYPETRAGQSPMPAAQMRYWSLTGYTTFFDVSKPLSRTNIPGQLLTSIMDDEVVLDSQRRYVLVYSRAADRPRNATTANGVAWKEWGPQGTQAFTLRWVSVAPEWSFSKAPDQAHLGWNTSWASPDFDSNLTYRNNRSGFLGDYQPVVSYLSTAAFEAYGSTNLFSKLPEY
ncbi:MAG: hypothetical protein ABSG04_14865 [Verrucomicrobiota bacterium]